MTHKSNSSRKGQHQQPPFEIVLDDSCSIVCDDVPLNCTIRVMPVDGRSPPRFSPVSQTRWIEDYPPHPQPDCPQGEHDWAPFERDKGQQVVGPPIASPPPPMKSRRSIVDSVRRNIQENNGGATGSGIHKGASGSEDDFALRKTVCTHEFSKSSSSTPSLASSGSYSPSESRHSSPSERSAVTDRPLLCGLHSNSRPWGAQTSTPAVETSRPMDKTPQPSPSPPSSPSSRPSPPSSPSSRPSPPSPAMGVRCCAMADYDPSNYRSTTPERDSGGASSSVVVRCTYHGSQPCPVQSGSYCRTNRTGRSGGSSPPVLRGARSCKYHVSLPCPALAGVPCRGEIQKGGVSTPISSRSPSPDSRSGNSPRYPIPQSLPTSSPHSFGQDTKSHSGPELKSIEQRRASRSAGVAYPPRTISPPPKSPRSRSPPKKGVP